MTSIRATTKIAHHAAIVLAVALSFGAASQAIAAADPGEKPAAKSKETAAEKPVRYCVDQSVTGSILRRPRVCKTRQQWIKETGIDPAK
ncbi:hypothetical protein ACX40Y_16115 [Sphingomonas sp. RS6]